MYGVSRLYLPDFILFSITVLLNARLVIPKLAGAMLFPLARGLEVKDILRPFHCFHNRDISAVGNFIHGTAVRLGISSMVGAVLLGISSMVGAVLFGISSVVGWLPSVP